MRLRIILLLTLMLGSGGCGGAGEPSEQAAEEREPAQRRETVFDPLTSTIGRAQGVQQTVDEQAAEQRRRIEEAER
jgi:hypothetical protein